MDKGSEFILRIPLAAEARATPQAAPLSASAGAVSHDTARRVLIVDDNTDAAATMEILLKSLGHETSVAHNGIEALQVASDFKPDVILLDIGLPGLDGYEVARRLRALKSERPCRIVAVTGWGQDADKRKSEEAGFDMHLVKPVAVDDLEKALTQRNGATLH